MLIEEIIIFYKLVGDLGWDRSWLFTFHNLFLKWTLLSLIVVSNRNTTITNLLVKQLLSTLEFNLLVLFYVLLLNLLQNSWILTIKSIVSLVHVTIYKLNLRWLRKLLNIVCHLGFYLHFKMTILWWWIIILYLSAFDFANSFVVNGFEKVV